VGFCGCVSAQVHHQELRYLCHVHWIKVEDVGLGVMVFSWGCIGSKTEINKKGRAMGEAGECAANAPSSVTNSGCSRRTLSTMWLLGGVVGGVVRNQVVWLTRDKKSRGNSTFQQDFKLPHTTRLQKATPPQTPKSLKHPPT